MASAVSGKCFPTPNCCDNCNRKLCNLYKCRAKTDAAEGKAKSESSSGTCEKGNVEYSKFKADDKHKTKLKNARDYETGNTKFKSKGESSCQQEIWKKEKCEVNDKLGMKDQKRKSKQDDSKETSETALRLKDVNSTGNDKKGNMEGGKCKIDDDKKEKMDSKTKPKNGKEESDNRKVFKRCTGCFLMTYCDKTCQKEHWIRVHKYHCKHLSGKKVSNENQEHSCEECITKETASKDVFGMNSPKIGCRIKEESNRMRRELGVIFGFHRDGQSCNCGNQFACEHPIPMGKIQGSAVATGVDEMIVHAEKLCNAFIIESMKANEERDLIDRLIVLHKSILRCRVKLWGQILVYGEIKAPFSDVMVDPGHDVRDKVDIHNSWWKSLDFSLMCIMRIAQSLGYNELAENEITDPKLIGKYDYHQKNVKNVSMITKNNLWHRFKLWPTKINNSLVLLLPKDVFCVSCNTDMSGQVVGPVNAWNPSNPSAGLYGGVANNGGVLATCSPFRNYDCGKGYYIKSIALELTDEESQEHQTLLKKARVCHLCLKMSSSSHRCTECLAAQYCSKDCQGEDWNDFHKTVCSTWAEDPARRLISSKKQKEVSKESGFSSTIY